MQNKTAVQEVFLFKGVDRQMAQGSLFSPAESLASRKRYFRGTSEVVWRAWKASLTRQPGGSCTALSGMQCPSETSSQELYTPNIPQSVKKIRGCFCFCFLVVVVPSLHTWFSKWNSWNGVWFYLSFAFGCQSVIHIISWLASLGTLGVWAVGPGQTLTH